MAKKKRMYLGQVCEMKNGEGKYLRAFKDHVIPDGTYLNIKSGKEELADAKQSLEKGFLSQDMFNKIEERINNYPSYVIAAVYYDKETNE